MLRRVTAQRTKSPGVSTCTSPSRYLTLASPLKALLRSKRFIKARPRPFSALERHHTIKRYDKTSALEQSPLLFIATARPRDRFALDFAQARMGMRPNVGIGELDVESGVCFDFGGAADHGAVGGTHQSKAACEHILIAQRLEQFGLTVELGARARKQGSLGPRGGAVEAAEPVAAVPRGANEHMGVEAARAPLEPVAMNARIGDKRALQVRAGAVETLTRQIENICFPRQPARQSIEAIALDLDPAPERGRDADAVLRHGDEQVGADRHGALRGRRRGRRAIVGDDVENSPVGLVSDGRDQRDRARGGRARYALLVEAPQIFEAAAAPRDDDEIGARDEAAVEGVEAEHGGGGFERTGLALHPDRPNQNVAGKAVGEAMKDVADHSTRRRSDDADDAGQEGQPLLARLEEQALGGEHLLALFEQRHERAGAGGLERIDDDLIFRPVGISGDAASDDDFEPGLGLEFEPLVGAPPDHRLDRCPVVLKREVAMAARMLALEARDFAAQAHQPESVLERPLERQSKLRDAIFDEIAGGSGFC